MTSRLGKILKLLQFKPPTLRLKSSNVRSKKKGVALEQHQPTTARRRNKQTRCVSIDDDSTHCQVRRDRESINISPETYTDTHQVTCDDGGVCRAHMQSTTRRKAEGRTTTTKKLGDEPWRMHRLLQKGRRRKNHAMEWKNAANATTVWKGLVTEG